MNAEDKDGYTALFQATWDGHTDIVKILLNKGATVNVTTKSGQSALKWAKEKGYTEIVELLKQAGAKE